MTGPNDGCVKRIGKSEFFNHVYKVLIDIVDIGKTSAQNNDVRVQYVYDGSEAPGETIPIK